MDQSFTAFLGYGGRTFVTFTTFFNIWDAHFKEPSQYFILVFYLKNTSNFENLNIQNFW